MSYKVTPFIRLQKLVKLNIEITVFFHKHKFCKILTNITYNVYVYLLILSYSKKIM